VPSLFLVFRIFIKKHTHPFAYIRKSCRCSNYCKHNKATLLYWFDFSVYRSSSLYIFLQLDATVIAPYYRCNNSNVCATGLNKNTTSTYCIALHTLILICIKCPCVSSLTKKMIAKSNVATGQETWK